jgi:hypothetical protein
MKHIAETDLNYNVRFEWNTDNCVRTLQSKRWTTHGTVRGNGPTEENSIHATVSKEDHMPLNIRREEQRSLYQNARLAAKQIQVSNSEKFLQNDIMIKRKETTTCFFQVDILMSDRKGRNAACLTSYLNNVFILHSFHETGWDVT